MSDSITIARPYAKAVFEQALSTHHLKEWSHYLRSFTLLTEDNAAHNFLTNPAASASQKVELVMTAVAHVDKKEGACVQNFIEVLAHNKRLSLLPDIMILFEELRSEQEKTMTVNVTSFAPLSALQQEKLITSLSKRLQRKVTLSLAIDTELMGGAVIYAGDLVIDGTVREQLNKLRTGLAA